MTTRERREEYSTANVVRVLHPTRPLSPNNAATDFDNNLDYLLDDLQSSVSRSGSALDYETYPSNTTTTRVIRDGDGRKVYKTAHYEYSTSSGGGGAPQFDVQQNINQLDSLLVDLKHERDTSLDRDKNFSNVGIDSGLLDPNTRVTKTIRTYTTNTNSDRKQTNRELQFDSPVVTTHHTTRQSRSRQRSPTYQQNVETKVTRDIAYDVEPVPDNIMTTKNRSYTSNYATTGEQQQVVPYNNNNVVEINSSNFPTELNGVPLSGDILPGPGTKVTTTIKTFTYEIPGDTQPPVPTNKTFMYKNEAYSTQNKIYPERDIPSHPVGSPTGGNQTVMYKNETYNTINRTEGYPGYPNEPRGRSPHPDPNTNTAIVYKRDVRETTSNVYPPPNRGIPTITSTPPDQTTIIYKHDITNTNTNVHHPPSGGTPVYPYDPNTNIAPYHPGQPSHTGHPGHPVHPGHHGQPGPTHTYIYKHEKSNTKNTVYGPPGSDPNERYPQNYTYPNNKYNSLPPQSGYPNDPSNVTYKYSTNTTTRHVHGSPNDRQPLLAPAPFPTDGLDHTHVDGNPPKRLDDLLATFNDGTGQGPNGRFNDEPYTPRKEINTALATGKAVAIVEPKVPTKNIAGPPVYYPPGHELSLKSEQSSAAWRAQGGYAKASGKYEYESSSKSKSSSKSGAAVVPVCLPLCCAMPCVIM